MPGFARLSRREFLLAAGVTLGATALVAGMGRSALRLLRPDALEGQRLIVTEGKENTMDKPILVTYASCTGATVGVAQAIGQTLRESGLPVEVRPMQEVSDIAPYRAVVAGSAIQGRQWLPEAMEFMQRHQTALAQRPFAAFLVCMALASPNAGRYRQGVAEWLEPVRVLVRPVSEGLFAGALDISKVPGAGYRLMFRMAVALGFWREGDHRDWQAIRTWAAGAVPDQAALVGRLAAL